MAYRSHRERRIEELGAWLARRESPRLQMALIVVATGLAALVLSFALLHLGIERMWLRYPAAAALSYLVFFLILGLWVRARRARMQVRRRALEIPDLDPLDLLDAGGSALEAVDGGHEALEVGSDAGSSLDLPDLDDGLVVVLILALLGALLAAAYVVYTAPALLAELLLDGVLMTALYRRLRGVPACHWIAGAFRRTWAAVLIVAMTAAVAGWGLGKLAPEATSVVGV
jgi:hypothetical protein